MADKDLNALLLHTMKDVYFAENAILKALPKMSKAAKSKELKAAFDKHLKQTEGHVARLDQAFKSIGVKAEGVPCEAIKGILKEGDEVAEDFAGGIALDAGLIAAAQAVEHYEISRYGALQAWAKQLGLKEPARLFGETLDEEEKTDQGLTDLANSKANIAAAAA
ncbi:ferritin-like domain-containing protein [Starkeya sp. ORNL1]|uniref:YciE/YciF ferroxidase family protein n=1 Tax=Starkeya sp. ORNL1 TaxID=2709380 RepID=UPI0014633849|nr:ferritin-like domain-containing protein [Starkeya sp. ORNL1]QJP13241.1 ferritin-like domain-containing protein [Starkeya sp. ORNL1]